MAFAASTPTHENRVQARFTRLWPEIERRFASLYGQHPRGAEVMDRLKRTLMDAALARPQPLRALDAAREADPDWLQTPGQSAYTFYVDRFAGDLNGVRDKLDYLSDLGVRWLHPLPLLEPRPGDSDGGFAVADYRKVDPKLGTIDDLEALADDLRRRDMGLILDVVCNHTAREHAWAVKARAGDPAYRDYYIVLPDAQSAAGRDQELIDVFPDTAPGSFTYDAEMGGYVWTTFYPFQWDLNYANPAVFAEMLEVLIFLAGKGAQGFRLDSAPFLWKQAGTTCRNLPQTYDIVEAWRAALSIVAPGVVLLAEAIESLEDVIPFFGRAAPGCNLAYNNVVMTALWAALADGDAAIARHCLAVAARKPAQGVWLNYVRCHDDLIWNALAAYAPPADLARWSAAYGRGEGFSRGRAFQTADGGVPSTNGMAASLVGLDAADDIESAAARRLCLLYGVIHALDGWPLIYMGDEIGLGDDETYEQDPLRAGDGRWLHRPLMDWRRAERRRASGSVESGLFTAFARFGRAARALASFGVSGAAAPIDLGARQVLAFQRMGEAGQLLCVANLSAEPVEITLPPAYAEDALDILTDEAAASVVRLESYAQKWLVAR
ncbi:alpha-amylase family glycosyl hydrolase [Caulobacter sp. FWC26]|uniref:alpha-amylase family glycosyl hydrolase n=1 Tax=Caulobacter sp. FWC26 TaxID=69665 RepID=UPI000C148BBF|nr:alpha-amylase family glycosyl hydrolase [Caulobacter sp. FWC26]AZS21865.1 amylosucrase [Caulobacter sp. FWC26]